MKKQPVTLLIFYFLVLYIFLQFSWWAYLIFDLNVELIEVKRQLADFGESKSENVDFESVLRNKLLMITGEGLVFLLLLFIGFRQVRKSFMREVAAAKQQKNFLLSVTHELNSPLASVKLFLQTLIRREQPREKQVEILEKSVSEIDRQSKLINNILTAAKVDNSSYVFRPEVIDLAELVKDLTDKSARDSHEVRFENTCDDEALIKSDVSAMQSIVINLLENAMKYSPQNSRIDLRVRCDENHIYLDVEDEGEGIKEEDEKRIFKMFYRSGEEETRNTKGTGLGLYLVRIFTESSGGEVTFSNKKEGGARFTVKLPLHQQS